MAHRRAIHLIRWASSTEKYFGQGWTDAVADSVRTLYALLSKSQTNIACCLHWP